MLAVFLSHSHADRAFARRLATDLENQRVQVWLDETELLVGDSLIDRISQAIDEADYVVAILSQSSVRSSWVQQELRQAMTQEVETRLVKVLPVLISDCDLPEFLRGKVFADFRKEEDYGGALKHLIDSVTSLRELDSATSSMMRRAVADWREHEILLELPRLLILSKSSYQPNAQERELIELSIIEALRDLPLAQLIDHQFELAGSDTEMDSYWKSVWMLVALVKRLDPLYPQSEGLPRLRSYFAGDSHLQDWLFNVGNSRAISRGVSSRAK